MGPRKKIKISKEIEQVSQNSSQNLDEFYFCKLPNEILAKIYEYLSPADLLSLKELGPKFVEVISCLRVANFSSCRKVNFAVPSLFSYINVQVIEMLNFNYNIFVKPHVLKDLICRCKNLKKLSVVECGIKYNHIIKILQSCTELEELSWNVSQADKTLSASCPSLKILYLFFTQEIDYYSVYLTIVNFPQVKNVFLNFAPDFLTVYPGHGAWMRSYIKSSECSRRYIILNDAAFLSVGRRCYLRRLFQLLSFDKESESESSNIIDDSHSELSRRYVLNEELKTNRAYSYSSDLQFESKESAISSLLSSGLSSAYSSVLILLTAEIFDDNVFHSLIQCVKKVAGNKLKHLTLQFDQHVELFDKLSILEMSDMFKRMFYLCPNITVLNIANVHFAIFSPIKAIFSLKNLRILNMPSCCFESFQIEDSQHPDTMESLEEMAKRCPKMENFSLICCDDNDILISEDKMNFVTEWKQLKHLTIYNINFKTFKFLRRIADSCKQLESLSLISSESHSAKASSLFTEDVIYVLKTAKNLSFLRINHSTFNPMFERFFGSIEEAVNLEGICIVTNSEVRVVNKTILKAINKLKYLHLFHFCHPNVSERLYNEVKKSMNRHGVKNMKIEIYCRPLHEYLVNPGSLPHGQPNICCSYMHLKNMKV